MIMNPESGNKNQGSNPKNCYSAPCLIIYGEVRNLTQSGSKGSLEWDPIPSRPGCWPNTARRPCSERRVKESIVRIGDHPLGFGLYLFDYRPEYRAQWGQGRQFGVMIDEVERVVPEAVSMHPDGYRRVDHSLLGIKQYAH